MKKFSVLRAVLLTATVAMAGTTYAADAKPAPAAPQAAPKPSTDIKGDMIKACTDSFIKNKILSNADAAKFCRCNTTTEGNLKVSDTWEIQSMINAGKDPSTHPAIVRSKNEMKTCAGDDVLNTLKEKTQALRAQQQQAAPVAGK